MSLFNPFFRNMFPPPAGTPGSPYMGPPAPEANLGFGDRLGMYLGSRDPRDRFDWSTYANSGMGATTPNPMQGLGGLMSMAGQGGQRPYQDEIASMGMPPSVQSLISRGLMG